jgi:hypothetical protein
MIRAIATLLYDDISCRKINAANSSKNSGELESDAGESTGSRIG